MARFGALAVADFSSKALAFIAAPIIIRQFGDRAFGDLGVTGQMMAFALLFGTCGLDTYSVRTIAVSREHLGRWASTVMALRLTLGLAGYAVVMGVALLVPQYRAVAGLLAVVGLSLFTRAAFLDWAAQALQFTRVLGAAMLTTQAVYLGLIIAVAAWHQSLWMVAAAQVAAEAATAAWLLYWFDRHVTSLERPFPVREWPGLLRHSFPFAGGQLLRGVSLGLDLVLLGAFLIPRQQIGWYSGSLKLYQLCSGTVTVYFMILLPRLSVEASKSPGALQAELRRSMRLIVPLGVMAATITALLAKQLLLIVGGSVAFEQAAPALRLLLAAVAIGLIGSHFRNALFAMGRQRIDLDNTIVSSVAHVVLKLSLIPVLGMLGAAIGTVGGETVLMVLGAWAVHRELQRAEALQVGVAASAPGAEIA